MPATATAPRPCSPEVDEALSDALWALSRLQVRCEWERATVADEAAAAAACRRVLDLLAGEAVPA